MIKLALLIATLGSHVSPGVKPVVLRAAADVYVVPGEGRIETVGCTVTADGDVSAKVVGGPKPWVYFYDRDGSYEADCQVLAHARPVLAPEVHRPIRRGIAVLP